MNSLFLRMREQLRYRLFPHLRRACGREAGQAISRNSGQVMAVSVVLLGGMILSAAVVSGTLLTYQIRQMNDVKKSAAAFYASDSGMEAAGFCLLKPFRCPTKPPYCPNGQCYNDLRYPMDQDFVGYVAGSGPMFTITKAVDIVTKEANVVAKGEFANAVRALEAIFILP